MLIKIALNGARPKSENQNIPHSLKEIEEEVERLFQHGFNVFHIHCYNEEGNESLEPGDVEKLVKTVKNISGEIKLGISSGEWIEPDFEKRFRLIENWKVVPDFISVNMIEEYSIEISELVISNGIGVEAGLDCKESAAKFVKSKLADKCLRILIEPEPEIFREALKVVNDIEEILDRNIIKIPRLLHGFNNASWELIREAKKRGYDSRIGLEDTILLENCKLVKGNLELGLKVRKVLHFHNL